MASILCLISCNNRIFDNGDELEEGRITLNMSDAVLQTYSNATTSECKIDTLWVLEFNSAGALLNSERILGTKILGNGQAIQLLPQLSFKPANGSRIVCIANTDTITYPYPNASSITLSNINTYFLLKENGYYFGGENLPMYGEIASWPSAYSCEMVRAVAKIQVQIGTDPSDVTGTFKPENVTYKIYNEAVGGYIQPQTTSPGIWGTSLRQTAEDYRLLQYQDVTEKEKTVYLYEFKSSVTTGSGTSVTNNLFSKDRQHIILKKNKNSVDTYYRLDFYDPMKKEFLDTKRNHHYIFNINRVGSEGYSTLTDAQNNPGNNIEYTVEVKDGSSHVTSNGQYAIVTSVETAYVQAGASNVAIATARFQLPTEMSGLGTGTVNTITVTDALPANSISLISPTALTNADVAITITTTLPFESAKIKLTLGNIVHYIVVKKMITV